jgi:hypothetical protein
MVALKPLPDIEGGNVMVYDSTAYLVPVSVHDRWSIDSLGRLYLAVGVTAMHGSRLYNDPLLTFTISTFVPSLSILKRTIDKRIHMLLF